MTRKVTHNITNMNNNNNNDTIPIVSEHVNLLFPLLNDYIQGQMADMNKPTLVQKQQWFYLFFMQQLNSFLQQVCDWYKHPTNPQDTRNTDYWYSWQCKVQYYLEQKEEQSAEESRRWMRCFYTELQPYECLLKRHDLSLFQQPIAWFARTNFCPGNAYDCNHSIKGFVQEAVFCRFIHKIWQPLNNLYSLCELEQLFSDEHWNILSGTTTAVLSNEFEMKVSSILIQCIRENHEYIQEQISKWIICCNSDQMPLGLFQYIMAACTILPIVFEEIKKIPFHTPIDPTLITQTLKRIHDQTITWQSN